VESDTLELNEYDESYGSLRKSKRKGRALRIRDPRSQTGGPIHLYQQALRDICRHLKDKHALDGEFSSHVQQVWRMYVYTHFPDTSLIKSPKISSTQIFSLIFVAIYALRIPLEPEFIFQAIESTIQALKHQFSHFAKAVQAKFVSFNRMKCTQVAVSHMREFYCIESDNTKVFAVFAAWKEFVRANNYPDRFTAENIGSVGYDGAPLYLFWSKYTDRYRHQQKYFSENYCKHYTN
jgi:hypothetical protein